MLFFKRISDVYDGECQKAEAHLKSKLREFGVSF